MKKKTSKTTKKVTTTKQQLHDINKGVTATLECMRLLVEAMRFFSIDLQELKTKPAKTK